VKNAHKEIRTNDYGLNLRMLFYSSIFSKRRKSRVFLVPPAHPGNLGDMLCVAAALDLMQDCDPYILDLFSGLEPSMNDWSDFEDLNSATMHTIKEQMDGKKRAKVIYIAQDSIDSRYGDFHLLRLAEVITGLEQFGVDCDLIFWNATLSANYPLSEVALKLLKKSHSIIYRDRESGEVLKSYKVRNTSQIFDLSSVYLLKEKIRHIDKRATSGAIGLSMGHQILEHRQDIIQTYRELQLLPPNKLLNLDSRVYSFKETDILTGLKIAETLGVSLNPKQPTSEIQFYADLQSKLDSLKGVSLVQTSRYHVAIASLILEQPVDLFAYNKKFDVLFQIWTQSSHFHSGTISYSHIEPALTNPQSLTHALDQWKMASKDLQR
jgi:hypothetical protein